MSDMSDLASSSSSSVGSSHLYYSSQDEDDSQLVQPSLALQELEGRIHPYEGFLDYKPAGKLTTFKKWKKRWFRVVAG